jgi:hypothetical protein
MMLYLFPFQGKVGVEFRRYQDSGKIKSRWPWRLRNWIWGKFAPGYAHFVTRFVPTAFAKRVFTGLLARILYLSIGLIRGTHTSPIDQQIRYPEHGGFSRYTFSIWGFPEGRYPELLPAYFEFCKEYERDTGFRCDLISVGYRVFEDRNPLFSYTWDGDVMTLDPVSTGSDGWHEFLVAYNEFCSAEGGVPLFNQTNHITRDQSQRAFGDRLATFERYRGEYDPENRLLTDYFREMLGL